MYSSTLATDRQSMEEVVERCSLLGGNFSILVQLVLMVICFFTLVIKRFYERPQRNIIVWTLDGLKQGIGSMSGHLTNILLSPVLARKLIDGDECEWYCLIYLTDATLGISFNLLCLTLIELISSKILIHDVLWLKFGDYGNPPRVSIWFGQLSIWLLIVMVGKILIFSLFYLLSSQVDAIMTSFFAIFKGYPRVELVFVMILIPFVLNILQFWVQDAFLKQAAAAQPTPHKDRHRDEVNPIH
jgi:hypothetical protein